MSDNNHINYYRMSHVDGDFLDKPRHGSTIEINERRGGVFHLDRGGLATTPLIRSYSDGIRVGCTFITNEAIKKIHGLHQRYLTKEDYVTHQEEGK